MPYSLQSKIATTITFANLACGSLSLVFCMKASYILAALFILLGVVMDGMDGKIARRWNGSTDFGKELDSLCDMVSFGVAPALLLYFQTLSSGLNIIGLIVVLFYIMCGAYRLARFNVSGVARHFTGMPITLAGAAMAAMSLLSIHLHVYILIPVIMLLSVLMISNIRVPKL